MQTATLSHPIVTALLSRSPNTLPRTSCRDPFKAKLDSYCGLCIVALYCLYLNLVKGALSVFDCSKNKDGVYILDADPSIKCNVVRRLTRVIDQ